MTEFTRSRVEHANAMIVPRRRKLLAIGAQHHRTYRSRVPLWILVRAFGVTEGQYLARRLRGCVGAG
jgi:hypothetical protein